MPKKHISGFVPIPFKLAGKILLPVSVLIIVLAGIDYFIDLNLMPIKVFLFGVGLLLLSLYLVTRPEE